MTISIEEFPSNWKTIGSKSLSEISETSREFLDQLWPRLQRFDLSVLNVLVEPIPDVDKNTDLLIVLEPKDVTACSILIVRDSNSEDSNWTLLDNYERLICHIFPEDGCDYTTFPGSSWREFYESAVLGCKEGDFISDAKAMKIIDAVSAGAINLHVDVVGSDIVHTRGYVQTKELMSDRLEGIGSIFIANIMRKFRKTKTISVQYSSWPFATK